jgi:predicted metal-binding membrane protein
MLSKVRSASWPDAVLTAVLATLVLLAWWSLWQWGHSPQGHLLFHGSAHPDMVLANPLRFAVISIAGWTLMTVAMMLPTSVPLLVLFRRIVGGHAVAWLLAVVIFGYVAVWTLVGAGLQVVNWLLHAGVDRLTWPAAAPWIGAAAILAIAGLYQFSRLKYACLEKCRSPLSFLIARWQGGNESLQALRLGAAHGLFCVGCCWSLMLLMFVVGVGGLSAMLVLGAIMAVEKNFAWGRQLSTPLGIVLLVGAGAAVVAGIRT